MSLFKAIPHVALSPNVARRLSPAQWQDYFVLFWWIFFFPQALRDHVAMTYPEQGQRRRLLQMTTILFLILLVGIELLLLVVQLGVTRVTGWHAWQGLWIGTLLGGLVMLVGLIYARSSEIRAALAALRSAVGQALWRFWRPLLQRVANFLLQRALGRVLWPLAQRIFPLLVDHNKEEGAAYPTMPDEWTQRALAAKFARGAVLGLAAGLTTALGGTLLLTPMLAGRFVDFTTSPLYGLLVGTGVGLTLNLRVALSDNPLQRLHQMGRLRLLGAVLMVPAIDSIQSIANPETWIDLSLDALSVAGTGAVAFYVSAWLAAQRPLDWLVHNYLVERQLERDPSQLMPPHVTLLPVRALQNHLEAWLATDWEGGLKNAHQLWLYTCQYPQIVAALHNVLATLPADQQVATVTRFVDSKDAQDRGYPWAMILYRKARKSQTIAHLGAAAAETAAATASKYVQARRKELHHRLVGKEQPPLLPLDSAAQVTVAGFWYLNHAFFPESATAFTLLPETELSQEIQALTNAFCVLLFKENLLNQPRVELPERPKEPKRKATWDALGDLRTVIRYGWLYKQCIEPEKREAVMSLAAQKLTEIVQQEKIARVDRSAIIAIVKIWKGDLAGWQQTQHKAQSMKACNPFICFEPVRGQPAFVGRDGLLKQLRQAWTQGSRQPLLLYGPAQSGKTSLIQRAQEAHKEEAVVVPIHLAVVRKSGNLTNRILWTLYQALVDTCGYQPIREHDFLLDPFAITERATRIICGGMSKTLVLVIDEFDLAYRHQPTGLITQTGDLVPSRPATEKLLEFWWHLYRSIHNLTFVFIIQSPRQDFPQSSFDEYLWPVAVGNLDKEAVGKVLFKPNPDFSPLFTPDAVDSIMTLTHGQPFLVQLLGHLTMQRFNGGLSKDPQPSPVFIADDVQQALAVPQYQQSITHHVTRMLHQLEAEEPASTLVLRAVAQHADGISTAALTEQLAEQFAWAKLELVLGFLHTQGILKQEGEQWQIAGELVRRELGQAA
ncbi:MAG: ATP-binding protein [Caldilineaceae bacterium]|nr:ATP-binding protein [Caldilineaceae bacterium]